jgi:OOP family OmpA-OmpF porin
MTTKALAALAGAVMLAASSATWAQAYLGLAIGQAKFKNACEGAPSAITCNDQDHAFKFFGGYQFTPHLAVELGIGKLGTAKATSSGSFGTTETADLSALELTAVGSWPFANRFAIHGKLGVYEGEMESKEEAVPAVFPPPPRRGWRSTSSTGLTYGIGASYAVTDKAVLRLEWQRYNQLGGEGAPKLDIDVLSIGALFRF